MNRIDWAYILTSFDGRIGRKHFWYGFGAILLINLIMQVLIGNQGLVQFVITILLQIAAIGVCVKRCHDREKSGWWCLLLLVPYIGVLWAIVDLGLLEGTRGSNRFGPDPQKPGVVEYGV
ncbi:MAG: DUF805 domain-containing protein [Pseudomonadota bacterium]